MKIKEIETAKIKECMYDQNIGSIESINLSSSAGKPLGFGLVQWQQKSISTWKEPK